MKISYTTLYNFNWLCILLYPVSVCINQQQNSISSNFLKSTGSPVKQDEKLRFDPITKMLFFYYQNTLLMKYIIFIPCLKRKTESENNLKILLKKISSHIVIWFRSLCFLLLYLSSKQHAGPKIDRINYLSLTVEAKTILLL